MKQKSSILIVDDEPIACDVLEDFLIKEDYHFACTYSGSEALAYLDEKTADVILLDIMMPGMDGFEVCRRIKANRQWRHIPIILITALGEKEDLVHGLEVGADDFLHKPVDRLELQARVRSMLRIKKQYDELQSTLRLRENMARMIVHDMRNPLSVIMGYSTLLATKSPISTEDLLEDLKKIESQAHRLNTFLNDMLMLAKMEAGQPILQPSTVDMNQLIRKVVESHNIIAQSRSIKLTIDLPVESRPMSLDANLFQRVLDNLLSNALKFSPVESTVTVHAEYPSQPSVPQIRLKVLDEGPGVSAEHRDRIFDKFEVVTLQQYNVRQVGLGLAFCKMVVEAHGGHIFVEANEPTGSVFITEL